MHMLRQTMNSGQVSLWKKLAMVKDCNCGNSQLGRGVLTDRGRYGKRMVNFCRRPLQCLCCGEI